MGRDKEISRQVNQQRISGGDGEPALGGVPGRGNASQRGPKVGVKIGV